MWWLFVKLVHEGMANEWLVTHPTLSKVGSISATFPPDPTIDSHFIIVCEL